MCFSCTSAERQATGMAALSYLKLKDPRLWQVHVDAAKMKPSTEALR